MRKLGGNSCVGSIDGLYKSIVDMNDLYFMSKFAKNRLVDPYSLLLMSLIDFGSSTTNEGNVRMFAITDDLVVTLYSPTSDLNCIGQITEKIVSIGLVEVILYVVLFLFFFLCVLNISSTFIMVSHLF